MENSIQIDLDQVLHFIKQYRALEMSSLQDGFDFIERVLARGDKKLYSHLCDHWQSKEKRFGSFYLNLSYQSQIRILRSWGILDPDDLIYLSLDEDDTYFKPVPVTAKAIHTIMLYFLNHGIDEEPSKGIALTHIPAFENCFGNSENWGNYVLNHPQPESILDQILKYYEG